MMGTQNFDYVDYLHKGIYEECRAAEKYLYTDMYVSASKMRSALETTITYIIKNTDEITDKMLLSQQSLLEKIKYIDSLKLFPQNFIDCAHIIRKIGNRGVHHTEDKSPLTLSEMIEALKHLYTLEKIVVSIYCVGVTSYPQFCVPEKNEPENRTADFAPSGDTKDTKPQQRLSSLNHEEILKVCFGRLELNEDQKKCVSGIFEFLNQDEQKVFIIKGFAGTGKTCLVRGIAAYTELSGIYTRITAPTGKAARVLTDKCNQQCNTVYREIYICEDVIEKIEKHLSDNKQNSPVKVGDLRVDELPDTALLIVDESSLVNDEIASIDENSKYDPENQRYNLQFGSGKLLSDIVSYLNLTAPYSKRKLIIIGDDAQLPPVGMNFSPAMSLDYFKSMFKISCASYFLTEIVRQKEESSIIKLARQIHQDIDNQKFSRLSPEFDNREIFKCTGFGYDEVVKAYIDNSSNKKKSVIIAYSNKDVLAYNRKIRDHYFKDPKTLSAYKNLQKGELLLVSANNYSSPFLCNGDLIKVTDVDDNVIEETTTVKIGDISETVTLRYRKIRFITSMNSNAVYEKYIIDNFLEMEQRDLPVEFKIAQNIIFFRSHQDIDRNDVSTIAKLKSEDPLYSALIVKFGYAITCHKAQGSEWDCAIVDCNAIGGITNEQYFRWFYTAITRAKELLILKDPPDTRKKLVIVDGKIVDENRRKRAAGAQEQNSGSAESNDQNDIDTQKSFEITIDEQTENSGSSLKETLSAKFNIPDDNKIRSTIFKVVSEKASELGFTVTDVIERNYQEQYTLRIENEIVHIQIFYKGNGKVSRIIPANQNSISAKMLCNVLTARFNEETACMSVNKVQSDHFLSLIKKLNDALGNTGISIIHYEQKGPYMLSVVFKKVDKSSEFYFYCNKNNDFTTPQLHKEADFSAEIVDIINREEILC